MKHCLGAPEGFQADCGQPGPHGEHDYDETERCCLGAPAGFEADCGRPGPHGPHPITDQ